MKVIKGIIVIIGISVIGSLLVKGGMKVGCQLVEEIKQNAIIEYKELEAKNVKYKYNTLGPSQPKCDWIEAQEGILI